MSNKLVIPQGNDFVTNFLGTIGKVAEDCIINVTGDDINSLCSTSDGTLIQYITYNSKNKFSQTLNVPDVKRLHKIVGCVQEEEINLDIHDNCISYTSPVTRFKYHLLDDGILSTPPISVEKISKLEYDCNFSITHSKLTELIKGSTFANESEKLYLYTSSDGNLYGELTDKEKPNMDSFCIKMSEDDITLPTIKPMAFNFENIRIISSTRCSKLNFQLNTQMSVARVDITSDNCNISYIISALIK